MSVSRTQKSRFKAFNAFNARMNLIGLTLVIGGVAIGVIGTKLPGHTGSVVTVVGIGIATMGIIV